MFLKLFNHLMSRNFPKVFSKRSQPFSTEPPYVLTKEIDDKALVILNRPTSLNTLNDKVFKELIIALNTLENNKSLVILKSAGGKAFSAGGDLIKLAAANDRNDIDYIEDVVMLLNVCIFIIHRYKIPVAAIMDGYTMGGGYGLCAFARYKIATERTVFAMPETKLGFHPNSAASYFFNHTKGNLGYYLGLSATSLKGSDVLRAGFATHYCLSKNLPKLEKELLNCSSENEINDTINSISEKNIPEFSLNPLIENIEKCFSQPTVEGILLKLKEDGSDWAKETFNTLNRYSPTCLKVTLRQLQRGRNMNLLDILAMESNLTVNFYYYPDVFEGTRVVLKDKNDTPKWNPSKLEDVSEELIENHFKPVGEKKQRRLLSELANLK